MAGVHRVEYPIVAFEPTPSGQGYWIVTEDGGIFAFGDAVYLGRLETPAARA